MVWHMFFILKTSDKVDGLLDGKQSPSPIKYLQHHSRRCIALKWSSCLVLEEHRVIALREYLGTKFIPHLARWWQNDYITSLFKRASYYII